MALSGTTNKITFTAVAGQTQFTVPSSIPFFDATTIDTANKKFGDIKVTKETAAGVITELTPDATPADGTEFKINATNGDPAQGCVVTIGAGATANDQYTVERDVAYTQEYDLQEGATIDPTALNKALDRVVAQNQQQNDDLARTITFPATDADSITYNVDSSATDRAGKVLGFDSNGSVTELAQISGSASVDTNRGLQLVNNQVGVKDDGITNSLIADDAVDTAQIADDAVEQAQIADNAVGTSQVANGAITKAKIENVTNMRVLGNTSGSTTAPQEVSVLDEDDLGGDTPDATALATQQSIKAYVDNGTYITSSENDNGYIKFPNGIIMQWGTRTPSSQSTTITFPIAFPNNVWNLQVSMGATFTDTNYEDNSLYWAGVKDTNSQFTLFSNLRASNETRFDTKMFWQAIGN